jgi:hypothetical protein
VDDSTSARVGAHPRFERRSPLLMDADEYEFWLTHDSTDCEECAAMYATVKFTEFGDYMAAQQGAFAAMPEHERQELYAWEAANLDGHSVGTSDWPGWIKYIGLPPWYAREPRKAKTKKPIPNGLRKQVFERDAYRCVSCGSWHDLQADHIIPESKGGPTTLENLQTMCRPCNVRKGAR